jgi:hypothetical protein
VGEAAGMALYYSALVIAVALMGIIVYARIAWF